MSADPTRKARIASYRKENDSDAPLFDDLVIGVASIANALRLSLNFCQIIPMLQSLNCPIKRVDEFRPGKGGRGKVWIARKVELDAWLDSRITGEQPALAESRPVPSVQSIREDLVIGRAAIMDLFQIECGYKRESHKWDQVEQIIRDHHAPIRQIGKQWMTRLSLLDEWLNRELRGEGV